jgi:putative peptidoglycan lipid II flippase
MVIAERFGTSREYDIFLIAVAAPIFFNVVIVRAVNFLTVPYLSRKLSGSTNDSDRRDIWSVLNSLLVVAVALVLFVILAAPSLIRLIDPNLAGSSLTKAVFYCRAISVLVLFGFLESFLRSALNVKKQFTYPALGTIILNIAAITIIYLFSGRLSVTAILLGLVVGYFFQVIFLLLKIWDVSFLRQFNFSFFNREVRKVLSVGGVIVLVEVLMSTFFLIDRCYASDLQEGVVSALNYCSLLVALPVSIVGYAIASVTFPYLSDKADSREPGEFASLLRSALLLALTVGIPCGVFYLVFARELTAAVFLRGAFDLYSLKITSEILVTLAPYLICLFLYTILIQSCYSYGRQKSVLAIAVTSVALKIILTGLFRNWWDYAGIGLATSVVQVVALALLLLMLMKDNRLTGLRSLVVPIVKVIVASVPILAIAYMLKMMPDFTTGMGLMSKLRAVPAGIISLLAFILIGYIVNIGYVREIVGRLRHRG